MAEGKRKLVFPGPKNCSPQYPKSSFGSRLMVDGGKCWTGGRASGTVGGEVGGLPGTRCGGGGGGERSGRTPQSPPHSASSNKCGLAAGLPVPRSLRSESS